MKMYALADAGKTKPNKPNQTQFLTQKTHHFFQFWIISALNLTRLCNIFPFGEADITITGANKIRKERAGNADWIRTDKLGCG